LVAAAGSLLAASERGDKSFPLHSWYLS